MADFCRQCSIELFGRDFRELADLLKPEDYGEGMGAGVLCEECGSTVVDKDGACIAQWCEKHGMKEVQNENK